MKVGFGPVLAVNLDHCCFVHVPTAAQAMCENPAQTKSHRKTCLATVGTWHTTFCGAAGHFIMKHSTLWSIKTDE